MSEHVQEHVVSKGMVNLCQKILYRKKEKDILKVYKYSSLPLEEPAT